jgi:hypothetical protein
VQYEIEDAENIINRCDAQYHVPSYVEWDNLREKFYSLHSDLLSDLAGSNFVEKFSNALYLPRAGTTRREVYHNGISNNAIGMCSEPWYQASWRSQR